MPSPKELAIRAVSNPKSSVGVYMLPYGYIDSAGTLHREVEVREITGEEEDLLASVSSDSAKKLDSLLARCLVRIGHIKDPAVIGEIVLDMISSDRLFLLFAIRQVTLGDELPLESTCPKCKAKDTYVVKISDLVTVPVKDRTIRAHAAVLPSGKKVSFRAMTGRDELKVAGMKDAPDQLSQAMLLRVLSIEGSLPTLEVVKGLGMRDRVALRAAFEGTDGGIDNKAEVQCPAKACLHKFSFEFDIGQTGFFSPLPAQKR